MDSDDFLSEEKRIKMELRKRAAEIAKTKFSSVTNRRYKLSIEEAYELIHELQIHQVELDLQNEELHKTQMELEASRARYFDIYDLAPVGYLIVNEKGVIEEGNLRAANLLGIEKNELKGKSFTNFISSESQDVYYKHHRKVIQTLSDQSCELQMQTSAGHQLWVRIDECFATDRVSDVSLCRIMITDISELMRNEKVKEELQNAKRNQLAENPCFEILGKVLIVDDEESVRRLLSIYLTSFGLTVSEAEDGESAYYMLKNETFEYIITDMAMPNMNGHELIHKIRMENLIPEKNLIVMTEEPLLEIEKADEVIQKPVMRNTLIRLFKKLKSTSS